MLDVRIDDAHGRGHKAIVTPFGELVTGRFNYSTPTFNSLVVDNQAYNFVVPKANHQIVITDIIVQADRNVAAAGAVVVLFTTPTGPTTATVTDTLLQVDMLKQTSLILNGINLITDEGVWINGKSTDSNINISVYYYYISQNGA